MLRIAEVIPLSNLQGLRHARLDSIMAHLLLVILTLTILHSKKINGPGPGRDSGTAQTAYGCAAQFEK